MPSHPVPTHGQWSSKFVFVLAAAGSAVGLGNIWKFPYMTGENGGGAFVIVYLICIAVIGLPVMMAEVLIGRRGRSSPINTMRRLATQEGRSSAWGLLGWFGVLAGFMILSYYSVIAGWSLAYVAQSVVGGFSGITQEQSSSHFLALIADPLALIGWYSLFLVMTLYIVMRGVNDGLELAVRYLMPALVVLLVLLIAYAGVQGNFAEGARYLFNPDFSKVNHEVILNAMGQAFFTLSLGMGAIMIYGSYLPSDASITGTTASVAAADTAIALMAGLAIFPIVFANGLEPGQGPGLIFITLPLAFGQMPGGLVFATLFFVLLVFAAWTSSISLLEPVVTWLVESTRFSRRQATLLAGAFVWVLGLGSVFSFNEWAELKWLNKTFFDWMDFLTSNVMLPLGGLFIALFAGWIMRESAVRDELNMTNQMTYQIWRFLIRFVTPVGIFIVFLNAIGLFKAIGWV